MVNENSAPIEVIDVMDVVGSLVHIRSRQQAVEAILQRVQHQQGGYVCLANVHMCMEAIDDVAFAKVLQQAWLVLADGRPVFWAQRLLGANHAQQVRGLDLVLELAKHMQAAGLRLGIYGGQDQALLDQLKLVLRQKFPALNIVYAYAPPFRPLTDSEDQAQVAKIIDTQVDILLVGLGCPKQEYWMAAHQSQLPAVMLGVGAAFDFIAGRKAHAPRLMQALGLEWLFRLLSEPRRLSGRYLKHNPRFMLRFGVQYFGSMIKALSDK